MDKTKNLLRTVGILALLLISLVPCSLAIEETENDLIMILVSDNLADSAVAQSLASNIESSVIIYVKWGEFNASTAENIIEIGPSQVIIIGGPLAVVPLFDVIISDAGIDTERAFGKDREETSVAVFNRFNHLYDNLQQVVIANGGDDNSVATALKESFQNGSPIIFGNAYGLEEDFNGKGYLVENNEGMESDARDIISQAKEKLQAFAAIVPRDAPDSVLMLYANAVGMLEKANAAFEENNFGAAFGLANAAYHLTEEAMTLLEYLAFPVDVESHIEEKALEWMEDIGEDLEGLYQDYAELGQEMPEVELLLGQVNDMFNIAGESYDNENYEAALNTLVFAEEMLKEIEKLISGHDENWEENSHISEEGEEPSDISEEWPPPIWEGYS